MNYQIVYIDILFAQKLLLLLLCTFAGTAMLTWPAYRLLYGVGRQVSLLAWIFLRHSNENISVVQSPSYAVFTKCPLPVCKAARPWIQLLSELQMLWTTSFVCPYVLVVWCLIKETGNSGLGYAMFLYKTVCLPNLSSNLTYLTYLSTYSIVQSPSREANWS